MGNYDSPLSRGSAELQFDKQSARRARHHGAVRNADIVETDATEHSEDGN